MKQQFLNSSINFLKKYNTYSKDELRKLEYGLEGLYLTFTKIVIIFLLALIFGIFKEVLIVLVLFNIIRYFGFGFHAEKSSECLILSIFDFIFIPLLFINVNISLSTSIIISGCCIISYLIYAPADTIKRPLKDKKKRLLRKTFTVAIGLTYLLALVLLNNQYITSLVLSTLVIQTIMISPVIYKIFRQPYNNYKNL